jgi:dihydroorotate dehydrogenase
MYKSTFKPIFFLFDAESVHHFVFGFTKFIFKFPFVNSIIRYFFIEKKENLAVKAFGLEFPNPIGLAAGFDKNGELIDELACFGFGFIEIGTVTPLPQPGNDKPRLFRLPADRALINRMGFNTDGLAKTIENLKARNSKIILGGNIGKNKITPNENATDDYQKCFLGLFPFVDYFVVNVSSPNTPNLRALQEKEPLTQLLNDLQLLNQKQAKPKPILLKIAPDLTNTQLDDIVEIVHTTKIDGIIATNTTIDRSNLNTTESAITKIGAGGLSGKPVAKRSTEVVKYLADKSNKSIPIIAVGGVFTAADAQEKLNAGACLVQVYTGFIYEGPAIAKNICSGLGSQNSTI